ncbi:MAG: cytochrome c [Rhodobacteraceae bacterium]|nr:cytochrome c [Paracoccaceae bacterium]
MRLSQATLSAAVISLLPGLAPAQDYSFNVAARKGEMDLMAINTGVLGNMAKGKTPYDADAATAAAANLVTISKITQGLLWPEGSSNADMQDTKALPKIWESYDDFLAKWDAKAKAAEALLAVAGDGVDALAPALGKLGEACTACHKEYRQPDK